MKRTIANIIKRFYYLKIKKGYSLFFIPKIEKREHVERKPSNIGNEKLMRICDTANFKHLYLWKDMPIPSIEQFRQSPILGKSPVESLIDAIVLKHNFALYADVKDEKGVKLPHQLGIDRDLTLALKIDDANRMHDEGYVKRDFSKYL